MTIEHSTVAPTETTQTPIIFGVVEGDSDLGLRPGDELEWNPDAPRGQRVTLRRRVALMESDLDRLQLTGKIVPPQFGMLAARHALVAAVLADSLAGTKAAA